MRGTEISIISNTDAFHITSTHTHTQTHTHTHRQTDTHTHTQDTHIPQHNGVPLLGRVMQCSLALDPLLSELLLPCPILAIGHILRSITIRAVEFDWELLSAVQWGLSGRQARIVFRIDSQRTNTIILIQHSEYGQRNEMNNVRGSGLSPST